MKTLILTEKPSVARDFAKALGVRAKGDGYLEGGDYVLTWAIGHLVELLEPQDYDPRWAKWRLDQLPVIPENFRYKPIRKTAKQLTVIRKLLAKEPYDRIVIATDAGREGEVIARTVLLTAAKKPSDPNRTFRFWTSQALTPQVIREGMANLAPATRYDRLWQAGQARQISDWLVGMNGSRAATLSMNDLFSIGRVQTAVLALIVTRHKEREKFVAEPYWLLHARFQNEKGTWWGSWFTNKETRLTDKRRAEAMKAQSEGATGAVLSVTKEKKRTPPPLLYALTDLQQDANRRYGFTAKKTLETAQKLYERKKCLSYPRTDSKVLGTQNVSMIRKLVEKLSPVYGDSFAGVDLNLVSTANRRVFNDAKLTDHHALIPLRPLPEGADPDERKIYHMVLKRFAAAFHPFHEYEQTDIITGLPGPLTFRTKGKVTLKPGWKAVYGPEEKKAKKPGDEVEQEDLPPLLKGDSANTVETKLDNKMTQPPPLYTEALLLKDMTNPARYVAEADLKKIFRGDVGLGTQATRAQIIETLLLRRYVRREKKHLIALEKGITLIDTLNRLKTAKILASPTETARWEMQLEEIAMGRGEGGHFIEKIKTFVSQIVAEFKAQETITEDSKPFGKCPACGSILAESSKAWSCSGGRAQEGGCNFAIWKWVAGKVISREIAVELLQRRRTGLIKGFVSKKKKKFSACLQLENSEGEWKVSFHFPERSGGRGKKAGDRFKGRQKKAPEAFGGAPSCETGHGHPHPQDSGPCDAPSTTGQGRRRPQPAPSPRMGQQVGTQPRPATGLSPDPAAPAPGEGHGHPSSGDFHPSPDRDYGQPTSKKISPPPGRDHNQPSSHAHRKPGISTPGEQYRDQSAPRSPSDVSRTRPHPPSSLPPEIETRYGNCPMCRGPIIEGKRGYGCSNWPARLGGCKFVIWKTISGKKLTEANIVTLLEGRPTRRYVFTDDAGNKLRAKLQLKKNPEKNGIWEPALIEANPY